MSCWRVVWQNSKGCHYVNYSNMTAVINHVEYCLKQGWTIRNIETVLGKGDYHTSIFMSWRDRNKIHENERQQILELLGQNEWLTLPMMLDKIDSPYRSDSMKRTEIRVRLYQLRDKGLIESIPETRPTKWRLKE